MAKAVRKKQKDQVVRLTTSLSASLECQPESFRDEEPWVPWNSEFYTATGGCRKPESKNLLPTDFRGWQEVDVGFRLGGDVKTRNAKSVVFVEEH